MTDSMEGDEMRMADAAGPVGREGERSSSALSTGRPGEVGPLAPGQRWSLPRKRAVVLRLMWPASERQRLACSSHVNGIGIAQC